MRPVVLDALGQQRRAPARRSHRAAPLRRHAGTVRRRRSLARSPGDHPRSAPLTSVVVMTSLPTAPFAGHESTRVIFGAAALGGMSQDRADATLSKVHEWGINHIDTAAGYGASEDRLQPWLAEHRDEVFLATKTGERTGCAARAELERSLERMAVEHVDLIQLHNLVEPDEFDEAFAPGGAVEALAAARDEGLVGSHRRHRPRPSHRRDASAQPRTIRLRVGAVAGQLHSARQPGLPSRRRGTARGLCRSRRGRPDHQVDRPRQMVRREHAALQLVRPAHRSRRHRACGPLRAVESADVPQHDERRSPAPVGGRRGGR